MVKDKFQNEILKNVVSFTKNVVVKPNWVNNVEGDFTSAKVLEWVFECFPNLSKFVVESYTPWRSKMPIVEMDDLMRARIDFEFYRNSDLKFFKETGIADVLKKHSVRYVNVAEEVWGGDCVDKGLVREFLDERYRKVLNEELLGYVPKALFEMKHESLFVDLARLKFEKGNKNILMSCGVKNLFGLIPVPKRRSFHGKNDLLIFSNVKDMFTIYDSLFWNKLFVVEGIDGMVEDYCSDSRRFLNCGNRFYVGRDGRDVDRRVAFDFGIDWRDVGYLR